jgi:proliferating cell nuclear antigen PCNA
MELSISTKHKFDAFSGVFRNLPVFMDIVNMNVDKNGIYIQGMDNSQVSLFELNLTDDWFDSFETDKKYVLGIHCATFYKVIQCLEDNEQVLKLKYSDGDSLNVSLEGSSKKINKYFELPLVDIDVDVMQIPITEYSVDMEIKSVAIANYINQLMIFDENFTIKCNKDNIIMKSKSESGSMSIEMSEDSIMLYAIEEELNLEQYFALTYIKNMCSFAKTTQSIVLSLKDETPLRLHQSFDEVDIFENSKSYMRFYVAPKIDDD